jgi:hypothetical protein
MERPLAFAAALLLALLSPIATRADDYGPRRDITAIRHDLSILVNPTSPITFDSIQTDGGQAVVQWHVGQDHHETFLVKRYGRWWFDAQAGLSPVPFGGDVSFTDGIPNRPTSDGYRVTLHFAPTDAATDGHIASFATRMPTEAESWANTPSGNAYFFFSGTVQSQQPVHVQAGTILDVWFPFVLDPSLRYSLTIAAPNVMSLGPVEGTLKNNALTFVLPGFTAEPSAELMGEIDSD